MDAYHRVLVKRRALELTLGLVVFNRGDWPIVDVWEEGVPDRGIGWLVSELGDLVDDPTLISYPDLMPEHLTAALNLPHGPGPGVTWAWGLRLIRRNLKRLALMAPRQLQRIR